MTDIQVIAASAGSGKTTRLSMELERAIRSGEVQPEGILATTFTNKAAAEIRERTRKQLLGAGMVSEAQRLTGARIGTVNSVCGRLVTDFALELGLPPDLEVLDEERARSALRHTLSEVLTGAEHQELSALSRRIAGLHEEEDGGWHKLLETILSKARSNDVGPEALADSASRSWTGLAEVLGEASFDRGELEQGLCAALEALIAHVEGGADGTKDTAKAVEAAHAAIRSLSRGASLPWATWATFETLKTGARSRSQAQEIQTIAARHLQCREFHQDLRRAIDLLFEVAARTLSAYRVWKQERGVLDFVDQEVLCLHLLDSPEVQGALAPSLQLVLVDEFQDTSPIQLALFLKLASLANRSVWVGDQKQSIYGFRDSDPALMDAVIAGILGDQPPETLGTSYRSRPALVRLVSEIFSRLMPAQGIPADRVRLAPRYEVEPEGLGAEIGWWVSTGTKKEQDVSAFAVMLRRHLEDPSSTVRDRNSGEPRPVTASDVAVLARTHADARSIAAALEDQGISVLLNRPGLLSAPEVRMALAGLRLRIDSRDLLARAELARCLDTDRPPSEWLAALLKREEDAVPFVELDALRRVEGDPTKPSPLGPVGLLDEVVESLDLRTLVRSWGRPAIRLANLESLRVLACKYVERRQAEGAAATPAGLLADLAYLRSEEQDLQVVAPPGDAVTICTYWAAKGLEWPITVLFGYDAMRPRSVLGVHMASDNETIDLQNPLAGRWIRFWPAPYASNRKNGGFYDALGDRPETLAVEAEDTREKLRLSYVLFTRARDRLVLAGRGRNLTKGLLEPLTSDDVGGFTPPAAGLLEWSGIRLRVDQRDAAPEEPITTPLTPGEAFLAAQEVSHPPAFRAPSQDLRTGVVGAPISFSEDRLSIRGTPDMERLGQAVHGFLATDDRSLLQADREAIARGLLDRWRVKDCLDAGEMVQMSDRWSAFVSQRWPAAIPHCEEAIWHRSEDGTIVRGSIDLLLRSGQRAVVLDYKSFPGSRADAIERAKTHVGQLLSYREAVVTDGATDVEMFVVLPISGVILEVQGSG